MKKRNSIRLMKYSFSENHYSPRCFPCPFQMDESFIYIRFERTEIITSNNCSNASCNRFFLSTDMRQTVRHLFWRACTRGFCVSISFSFQLLKWKKNTSECGNFWQNTRSDTTHDYHADLIPIILVAMEDTPTSRNVWFGVRSEFSVHQGLKIRSSS